MATVDIAANSMTNSQKEAVSRRHRKIATHRDPSVLSKGEGPSKPKGKEIDPREWGNLDINQDELDVEAQAAALKSLAHEHRDKKKQGKEHTKARRVSRGAHRSLPLRLPAESRPVAQIAQDSYLGMTLRNVGQESARKQPPDDGDGSYLSSEPTSTGSDWAGTNRDDDASLEGHDGRRQRRNTHHRRSRRRRRPSSSSSQHSAVRIKPIAPKEYNGQADARTYHRFVRESEAYLRDGRVKGRRRIFLLSYYLTDKAYDFYMQKVANDEERWTLTQFYEGLFNYCFPVDYRMQLRKTLARCHQNDRSVTEYVHELQELFNMIGDIPEHEQVLKFWNGSRPIIQKGL